jgi:mannose-6-phosphate isomerase-like protein (cupin superfamily)
MMDLESIKNSMATNVYYIPAEKKVAMHKHDKHDEIFYCIQGEGFGVLEDSEVELTVGKVFLVPAGSMHALRSDKEMYVASILVPKL